VTGSSSKKEVLDVRRDVAALVAAVVASATRRSRTRRVTLSFLPGITQATMLWIINVARSPATP